MKEPRIGVYICWCGTNIAKTVDVEYVAEEMGKMEGVVISKDYKYMCSDPGQELIFKDIKEHKLNRVVVASCSPRIHELTFRKVLEKAGLNPYLFEMANIREQVSWVHTDKEVATQKAKDMVRAAIRRVFYHESLDKREAEIKPDTLVIGAGITGISAALDIANSGYRVFLVDKKDRLGGMMMDIDLTYPYMNSAEKLLESKITEVKGHENIKTFLESEVNEVSGYVGNFEALIKSKDGAETEVEVGNIIVATGLKAFNPSIIKEYGYDKLPNVITSLEFEKMSKNGEILTKEQKPPSNVAIIHCVGSRNPDYHEYCSRVCCMCGLKYADQIKTALPDANVYNIYSDMRSFGKACEEFYTRVSRDKSMFLNFQKGDLPVIKKVSGENIDMIVELNEALSGERIEVPVDMVILLVGLEAQNDAKDISHLVGISLCRNDFFIEKHPKLDPVATTTDGVYIAGTCQSPKGINESIEQAGAASVRVLETIAQGKVRLEVITSVVNEDLCCGCKTCVRVCPYSAISFNEEKGVSEVNEILCKGCGTCTSACPSGAIKSRHFTDQQILSQIEGLMRA
jgi:heterodisulfide reductase subunit A